MVLATAREDAPAPSTPVMDEEMRKKWAQMDAENLTIGASMQASWRDDARVLLTIDEFTGSDLMKALKSRFAKYNGHQGRCVDDHTPSGPMPRMASSS